MLMNLQQKELIEQARMMGIPAHEFAAGFITRDLVACAIGVIRKHVKLHEGQEIDLIKELNREATSLVSAAVTVIAAKGVSAIGCTVKSVMVTGKNLRVVADVDASDPQRHALTDTVTQRALLVLAEDEYYDALDSNTAQKDQKDLPLENDKPRPELVPADDPYKAAYDHVVAGGEITPKAIQKAAGVKRKEAGDLIIKLAEDGVVSGPDDDGHRTLLIATVSQEVVAADAAPASEVAAPKVEAKADDDDSAYYDAVLKVQDEKKVSVSFLKAEFAVDEETAEAWIKKMEQDGVVSEENDMGGRAVLD